MSKAQGGLHKGHGAPLELKMEREWFRAEILNIKAATAVISVVRASLWPWPAREAPWSSGQLDLPPAQPLLVATRAAPAPSPSLLQGKLHLSHRNAESLVISVKNAEISKQIHSRASFLFLPSLPRTGSSVGILFLLVCGAG